MTCKKFWNTNIFFLRKSQMRVKKISIKTFYLQNRPGQSDICILSEISSFDEEDFIDRVKYLR